MSDMLAEGMAVLAAELKAHASKSVRFSVGGIEFDIDATLGQTEFKVSDGFGGVIVVTSDRDFIVTAADLVVAGVTSLPERGWQIRETVGSVVEVYEVRAPEGEQVYRRDPHGAGLRIHTKLIRREL